MYINMDLSLDAMITNSMSNSQKQGSQFCENEEPLSNVEKGWKGIHLIQYQGTWMRVERVSSATACRQNFRASKDDVILVTTPKSGTTWLKALAFAIVNRSRHDLHSHPLLCTNPHDLVPFLELDLFANSRNPNLTSLPSPRLFASHFSYNLLPESIIESNSRIVYLCRNPKDTFVSMWHYINKLVPGDVSPAPIEEACELFCRGVSLRGPFWEHVLGYWKASLERPESVLFLKFEELKEDPTFQLKRLAEFLGCPFSVEEEREGLIDEILNLCSFENLKRLEVNTSGKTRIGREGKHFFRRGVVGDWENHLTAQMVARLDQLTHQKLEGSGLSF